MDQAPANSPWGNSPLPREAAPLWLPHLTTQKWAVTTQDTEQELFKAGKS